MKLFRPLFFAIYFFSALHAAELSNERGLVDALNDFEKLKTELQKILSGRSEIDKCQNGDSSPTKQMLCSLKDLCQMKEIKKDSIFIYENSEGRKIVNEHLVKGHVVMRECLLEKYSKVIEEKKREKSNELSGKARLNLKQLSVAFGEEAELAKIASELLYGQEAGQLVGIIERIENAEKKLKLTLEPNVKEALLRLHDLKNNPTYQAEMESFEESLVPKLKMNDPLFDWELLTDKVKAGGEEYRKKNIQEMTKKVQASYAIFQEIKKEMLTYLNEKKNDGNQKSMERVIERIKTVKFYLPKLTPLIRKRCGQPTAFYDSDEHSLILCPQMLNYPRATLMDAIAHELSHSFDSCNFSAQMFKLPFKQSEDAPFDLSIKMEPILGNFMLDAEKGILEEAHPNESIDSKSFQAKMRYKDHPFSKTLNCLKLPTSANAQDIQVDKIVAKAKIKLQELKDRGQDKENNSTARKLHYFLNAKNRGEYFDYFSGCNAATVGDTLGRSQLEEAFAVKLSSEIIARVMKKMSAEDAQKAMLEIALGYGNICKNESETEMKIKEFLKNEGCKNYLENWDKEKKALEALKDIDPPFSVHLEDAVNIEKINFAHPQIREAIGCKKKTGAKYCE